MATSKDRGNEIERILASMGIGRESGDDCARSFGDEVRDQLSSMDCTWYELGEGLYQTTGSRFGCRYVDVFLSIDERSKSFRVEVDAQVDVPQSRAEQVRKHFLRANPKLIVSGLILDEKGRVRLVASKRLGDTEVSKIEKTVYRAIATVAVEVGLVYAIVCGVDAWELETLLVDGDRTRRTC